MCFPFFIAGWGGGGLLCPIFFKVPFQGMKFMVRDISRVGLINFQWL
jgi:hypothetical protein